MILFVNWEFARYNQVRMRSSWIRVAPKFRIIGVFTEEGNSDSETWTQREECYLKTQRHIQGRTPGENKGMYWREAASSQEMPKISSNHHNLGRGRKVFPRAFKDRARLSQHLYFRFLASRTVRE